MTDTPAGLTVTHRRYVTHGDAHYGGNLVNGAFILELFGGVGTEASIQMDGDEGLLASYSDVQFRAAVLAGDVATFAYMIVRLAGPQRPMYVVSARDPWPGADPPEGLRALGLSGGEDVEVLVHGSRNAETIVCDGQLVFPIQAGWEVLGEITVFSGIQRVTAADASALALLTRELSTVAQTHFLSVQAALLAQTDALTGLYNRRYIDATLDLEVERAAAEASQHCGCRGR